jgi:hypothetical protein
MSHAAGSPVVILIGLLGQLFQRWTEFSPPQIPAQQIA